MWLQKLCRLCGQTAESMKSIFACNDKRDSFELKLKKCLPIASFNSGDTKPKQVCERCYDKINEFYDFILICEAADYEIDQLLYENNEKWYQEATEVIFDTFNSVEPPVIEVPELKIDPIKTEKVNKPFSCHICAKTFTRSANVSLHVLQQHSNDKPHECSTCERKFASLRELTIHSRLHTAEFQCTYCKRVFLVKSKLERHIRTHTGEKPFSCTECNKSFNDKRNLGVHMRLHTDERPFECKICAKRFKLKAHLTEHERGHSKELGYTCDVCGRQFKWRANLQLHLEEHQGIVNECKMCHVTFTRRSQLNKHLNRCNRRMDFCIATT